MSNPLPDPPPPDGSPTRTPGGPPPLPAEPPALPALPPPLPAALPPLTPTARKHRRDPRRVVMALAGLALVAAAASYLATGSRMQVLTLRWRAWRGDGTACQTLGWRFREGRGVPQDFKAAAEYFDRAASYGVAAGAFDLAVLYDYGIGVPADHDRARTSYEEAERLGCLPAVTRLGALAMEPTGDLADALPFWDRAARAGEPWAQYLMGSAMLAQRDAAPENVTYALFWLEAARRQGVEPIKGLLQHVWATVPDDDCEAVAEECYRRLAAKDYPPPPPAAPSSP